MSEDRRTIDWGALRDEYEAGAKSLRQLAVAYGVSKSYIIERRNKEGWSRPSTDRPSTTKGRQHKDVNAANRLVLALSLCAQKLSYEEIAQRCGYADRSVAYNAIHRALNARIPENIDELRNEELYWLDRLHQEIWDMAMDKDNEHRLFAVDRLLAIAERRSRLMGFDARSDDMPHGATIVRQYAAEVDQV